MFIVTRYGCNSTPSDMWIPTSKIFSNYKDAYAYFLEVAPSLHDEWEKANQYINSNNNPEKMSDEYIVIEDRVQTPGYHCGEGGAKRPEGAVIARIIIKH